MDTLEAIVAKLNEMLEVERFEKEQFGFYIKLLEEKYLCVIRMVDFEFYNDERLHKAQTEKKKGLESQDFEYAAKYRNLERLCLKCLDYKTQWNINKSVFLYENERNLRVKPTLNYIYYCHFGSAQNDDFIKKHFNLKHL